jgi:hypothetical protein
MSTHAKLSPSAAHRWIECPGSIRMQDGLPNDSSPHAAEGTFAHDIAAKCLLLEIDAEDYIGHTGTVDGLEFECDAEMAGYVQEYLDEVRAYCFMGATLLVEERVRLFPDLWGTADAIVVSGDGADLHVFDFKYGAGVFVPITDNPQLGCYAAGAVLSNADLCRKVDTVTIHIVQPRHFQGGHHHQAVPIGKLMEWAEIDLHAAAAKTRYDDAPLHAGDHCQFCLAQPHCPEMRAQALAAAQDVFDDDNLALTKTPPAPSALTPEQLGNALTMFPVVEQWMRSVREFAHEYAERGGVVPDHKLVQKQGRNRAWVGDEETIRAKLAPLVNGASLDTKPKLLSPAQAEKLIRNKATREVVMSKLAAKPAPSGTVLVPTSDPRPTFTPGAVFPSDNEK